MVNKKRFTKNESQSFSRKSRTLELKTQGLKKTEYLVFGLRNIDKSQGEDFKDWEESEILAKALNRITGLCSMTLQQAITSSN